MLPPPPPLPGTGPSSSGPAPSVPPYDTIYDVLEDGTRVESAFRCSACGMQTRFRQSIQRHMRDKHSGVRHVCGACGAAYNWKISLARHRKTCTGSPVAVGGSSATSASGGISQIARMQLAQLDAANNALSPAAPSSQPMFPTLFPMPQQPLSTSQGSFANSPATSSVTSHVSPGSSSHQDTTLATPGS